MTQFDGPLFSRHSGPDGTWSRAPSRSELRWNLQVSASVGLLHGVHPRSLPRVTVRALECTPVDPMAIWTALRKGAGAAVCFVAFTTVMRAGDERRHALNVKRAADIRGWWRWARRHGMIQWSSQIGEVWPATSSRMRAASSAGRVMVTLWFEAISISRRSGTVSTMACTSARRWA